jgi:hypothetical protein
MAFSCRDVSSTNWPSRFIAINSSPLLEGLREMISSTRSARDCKSSAAHPSFSLWLSLIFTHARKSRFPEQSSDYCSYCNIPKVLINIGVAFYFRVSDLISFSSSFSTFLGSFFRRKSLENSEMSDREVRFERAHNVAIKCLLCIQPPVASQRPKV